MNSEAYFIGINGSGMLPLARMALLYGWQVSGSDQKITDLAKAHLKADGMQVHIQADPKNIPSGSIVVYSSAIKDDHVEKKYALEQSCKNQMKILHRMDFLNELFNKHSVRYGIAGTHGKTSTASLAGWVLIQAGLDPDILVGGHPLYLDSGVRKGDGKAAVFETDESDGSFLKTNAQFRMVLNIDHDHLEFYGSFEKLVAAFEKFIEEGHKVIVNADDPQIQKIIKNTRDINDQIYWYSTSPEILQNLPVKWHSRGIIASFEKNTDNLKITSISAKQSDHILSCSLKGRHYASNALGLLYLLNVTNPEIPIEKFLQSIATFPGVERRMQLLRTLNGIRIYDDYGHHPTEIRAVIAALKIGLKKGDNLHVVFQPHRYTRTKALYKELALSLMDADFITIMDLYSAGEVALKNVSSLLIVDELIRLGISDVSRISGEFSLDFEHVFEHCQDNDIVLFIGAGDISHKIRKYLGL